ncbi:PTS sugar transporter subunit IIC [Macrococcoides bohemicum]|uniref:PTS sugar transporter subunit IIC n=1 Tax=Macrococcoides bohemicum TaxID=1903056 RepID=UPI0022AA2CC9|nr:PTS sugar transporter subunit IIC [Macrococcus bohemicus]
MSSRSVIISAFVGSGAAAFQDKAWMLIGIGDLINTMLTASASVLIILWIKDRLGSLNIILLPIIAGGLARFGYSGLVGPINALKFMDGNIGLNLVILALAYIVIPVITGVIVNTLCLKFKIYSPEVFKFQSGE